MPRAAVFLILLFLALSACQPTGLTAPKTSTAPWQVADLRLLDPLDSTDPQADLMAAYARLTTADLEIRLDLLEFDPLAASEFVFELDFGPGQSWVIRAQAQGQVSLDAGGTPTRLQPRLAGDEEQDTVTLRMNRDYLPGLARLQVHVQAWSNQQLQDELPSFALHGQTPARAPLLLTFWDALPAATPAQALRRWDGAHTGPYGQRHGLAVLLQAAQQAGGLPLALLDLKTPESLSALNLLQPSGQTQAQESRAELTLPLAAWGDPAAAATALAYSRQAAVNLGFQASRWIYGAVSPEDAAGYAAAFARLDDTRHLADLDGLRLIPLADEAASAGVSPQGLSRSLQASLLQAALSPDPADLVSLGGSLPSSPWADSTIAYPVFTWLAGHPWVQVLAANDLLQLQPTRLQQFPCANLLCQPDDSPNDARRAEVRQQLSEIPAGSWRDEAWLTYLSLTRATDNPTLRQMQDAALEQVAYYTVAAQWSQNPVAQADCSLDLDQDQQSECVLSSETWLGILELDGGRLAFAAARVGQETLPLIGSSSQRSLGLGEPAEWQPERGLAADPQVIPGAFADETYPWVTYQAEVNGTEIRLTNPQSDLVKTFRVNGGTFQVDSSPSMAMRIPIMAAPGGQLARGWQPLLTRQGPDGITIQVSEQYLLQFSAQKPGLLSSFDSAASLSVREDPNTGYPAGHYLPFPLILVQAQTPLTLTITPGILR